MTQKEQLAYIEQCDLKSRANPGKTIKVGRGFYFLTVGKHLWHIAYDSYIDRWSSCTDDERGLYTDETRTKRQQIDCLLS